MALQLFFVEVSWKKENHEYVPLPQHSLSYQYSSTYASLRTEVYHNKTGGKRQTSRKKAEDFFTW